MLIMHNDLDKLALRCRHHKSLLEQNTMRAGCDSLFAIDENMLSRRHVMYH